MQTGGASDCQRPVAVHHPNPLDVGVGGAFSTALGSPFWGYPPAGTVAYTPEGFWGMQSASPGCAPEHSVHRCGGSENYRTIVSPNFGYPPEGNIYCPPEGV